MKRGCLSIPFFVPPEGSSLRLDLFLVDGLHVIFRLRLLYRFARTLLAGDRGGFGFSDRLDYRSCFDCSSFGFYRGACFSDRSGVDYWRSFYSRGCRGGLCGFAGQALGFTLATTYFARVVRRTASGIG